MARRGRRGEIHVVTQNILIMLVHYLRVVDCYLMFHVSQCAISCAHCVTIEEAAALIVAADWSTGTGPHPALATSLGIVYLALICDRPRH